MPEEELPLQAAMGVRYGFDDSMMDAVRGLTIVPAEAAGIDERVGSLEPGKDADLFVADGDPIDPRTSVERVFIEGRRVYDATAEPREVASSHAAHLDHPRAHHGPGRPRTAHQDLRGAPSPACRAVRGSAITAQKILTAAWEGRR